MIKKMYWIKNAIWHLSCVVYCGYLKENLICGRINWNLLASSGTQFTKSKKAYKNGLNIWYNKENYLGFLTGGGDGIIIVWDYKLNQVNKINIKTNEVNSMNYIEYA